MERSGGVAAIVCDTTGNTVRREYCYTCLAIGVVLRSGHEDGGALKERRRRHAGTVVQKGVFGESVSSLPPLGFALKTSESLKGAEKKWTLCCYTCLAVGVGVFRSGTYLVNLLLTNLVRISGFSSLLPAIAVFLCLPTRLLKKCRDRWENHASTIQSPRELNLMPDHSL